MAVSASSFSHDYPEFNPEAFRGRTSARTLPNVRRSARPSTRRNARTSEARIRRARRAETAGTLFSSRLMDDLCAVLVGAAGIFFVIAVARMLLMG